MRFLGLSINLEESATDTEARHSDVEKNESKAFKAKLVAHCKKHSSDDPESAEALTNLDPTKKDEDFAPETNESKKREHQI